MFFVMVQLVGDKWSFNGPFVKKATAELGMVNIMGNKDCVLAQVVTKKQLVEMYGRLSYLNHGCSLAVSQAYKLHISL